MTAYPAGIAKYRGDLRAMIGEVKGPTTYGTFVVAATAVYDATDDQTRVGFVHADADTFSAPYVSDGVLRVNPGEVAKVAASLAGEVG